MHAHIQKKIIIYEPNTSLLWISHYVELVL